ncbi:Cleavage stimulating factor 64 [Linum grandiflorum]
MASSSSQHRCVFVGNIPYDATEEQLIEICREVGPVVSFRLVIDRETGKPKGYGFCEYKDEETALSARRNLQGYEINGRQLRVDFAENDKNNDRNKEQGRQASNADARRQGPPPAIPADSGQHQPIGLHMAMTAATVMTGALGATQAALQGQAGIPSDPLTLHLAKMSRNQLNEVVSELKAQIMLGMVTPEVLQLPNIRAPTSQPALLPLQDTHQSQQSLQMLTGSAPPSQIPNSHSSLLPLNSGVRDQAPTSSLHPHNMNPVPLQAPLPGKPVAPLLPPVHPARPPNQTDDSQFLHQQVRHSSVYHSGQAGTGSFDRTSQMGLRPLVLDTSAKPEPLIAAAQTPDEGARFRGTNSYVQANTVCDPRDPSTRPTKLQRLDHNIPNNNRFSSSQMAPVNRSVPAKLLPRPEEKQPPQQIPSDVESALLQQVLSLTPEQLSSLPPEQQQQVIQLQQALRQDQMQPL